MLPNQRARSRPATSSKAPWSATERAKGAAVALTGGLVIVGIAALVPGGAAFAWPAVPVALVLGWWLTPAVLEDRRRATAVVAWFGGGGILAAACWIFAMMLTTVWGRPLNSAETALLFAYVLVMFVIVYAWPAMIPMTLLGATWAFVTRRLMLSGDTAGLADGPESR